MKFRHWLSSLLRYISPYNLTGITFLKWMKLLWDNQFCIGVIYWPRVILITVLSIINSFLVLAEKVFLSNEIGAFSKSNPIIVIGFFRSGTTFLHQLLCLDNQFTYPTVFQVRHPDTFIILNPLLKFLRRFQGTRHRLQDNVVFSWDSPDEDEVAMALQTGFSPIFSRRFPRRFEYYERYRTFERAAPEERIIWQSTLFNFINKVSEVGGMRPVIMKSPAHTARIRLLLNIFPQAKFVHIRRHPYHVFQSARHLVKITQKLRQFNNVPDFDIDENILSQYEEAHLAYFSDRELIPKGNLYEISYEALIKNPLEEIQNLYTGLGLTDFNRVESELSSYIKEHAGYQRNRHVELPLSIQRRLVEMCPRCFSEWGYDTGFKD